MMTNYVLAVKERDKLMENLNDQQRSFIVNHLKRGRKTVFANALAADKGTVGVNDMEWELIDYQDGGIGWDKHKNLKCECGKTLRYQYTVKNLETGVVRKFGINHFIEHTGISPELAKAIVKGWENIDYEMDELLVKMEENWLLEEVINPSLVELIDTPKDIQEHFNVGVPLLDRQIKRLKLKVNEYQSKQEQLKKAKIQAEKHRQQKLVEQRRYEMVPQLSTLSNIENVLLDKDLQLDILLYINDTTEANISLNNICQYLIDFNGASRETYPNSSTLRILPNVGVFLKRLVENGTVELVEDYGTEDKIFRKVIAG